MQVDKRTDICTGCGDRQQMPDRNNGGDNMNEYERLIDEFTVQEIERCELPFGEVENEHI